MCPRGEVLYRRLPQKQSEQMENGLPTFDYRDLSNPDSPLLQALQTTCHLTGFFYLRHPALVSGSLARIFRQAREFFILPFEEKNAIHISRSPHYRGYSILDEEETRGTPDHKETLDLGMEASPLPAGPDYHILQGPNQWPGSIPEFREATTAYLSEVRAVGEQLMRTLAASLSLPEETFARHFDPPYCMLRLIAYPPVSGDVPQQQGIGEHTDFGCLTILAQDDVGGLEVRNADGSWITAEPKPDCLIVNLGDMLETWTARYFMATPHRVRSPRGDATRFSIPFFLEPSLDTEVEPLPSDLLPRFKRETFRDLPSRPILYGRHMLQAFRRSYPGIANNA